MRLSHANRNLLLVGLATAGIFAGYFGWLSYRRTAVADFAKARLHGAAPAARTDGTFPCMLAQLSNADLTPVLTRCTTPTANMGAVDLAEVDLRYGAFKLRQTDLEVKDAFDVPLTRTYNSQDWVGGRANEFGRNTNHPYDIAPLGTRNPYTEMELTLEDGDFLYFKRVSPGTGFADAVYQHTETSGKFYKSTIHWNGNGWTLQRTDGEETIFPESYSAKNLAQGAPTEIRDVAENKLKLRRDRERNLTELLTPHGRWIRFTYNGGPRIARAEDDAGDWASYVYDNDGMLVEVIYSSGQRRGYAYEGSRMVAVLDGQGRVLLRNTYASGVLIAQTYPNGDVYRYEYVWSANKGYAVRVTITMPDGSKRELEPADDVPQWLRE